MKNSQQQGFTLIELMMVVVILAITLGLVFPVFEGSRLSSKLRAYSNSMAAAAASARSESIKRNADMTLCASSDGATCTGTWDQGWVVLDPDSVVIEQHAGLKPGFKMSAKQLGGLADVTSITFASSGVVSPAAHFELCQQSPDVGHQERQVKIYPTGRAKVIRTYNGACP